MSEPQPAKLSRKHFVGLGLGAAAVVATSARTPAQDATPVANLATPPPDETFINDVENLTYNNPFGQPVNPAWWERKQVFHLFVGGTNEEPSFPTVPQYLFVYEDEFEEPTTLDGFMQQPKLEGQFVIYPTVPGQPDYSPIWHNIWVLAPRDFEPNSIRSVKELMDSGLQTVESQIWIN